MDECLETFLERNTNQYNTTLEQFVGVPNKTKKTVDSFDTVLRFLELEYQLHVLCLHYRQYNYYNSHNIRLFLYLEMSKRGKMSGGSVTGGTGDVKPQIMTINSTQTAADTSTQTEFLVPVTKIPTSERATIIEILKIYWYTVITSAPAEADHAVIGTLSTRSTVMTLPGMIQDTSVIDGFFFRRLISTSGVIAYDTPLVHDMTDSNGNGILVATDSLFIQNVSSATGAANTITCRILYRYVNVGIMEYVGIVQSQQ